MKPTGKKAAGALARAFRSGIARRIMTLFVLSAVLPLSLFATLSLIQVSSQLQENTRTVLRAECKDGGMDLVERFHRLRDVLSLARGDTDDDHLRDDSPELQERLSSRFDWIALVAADGSLSDATREDVDLPELTEPERLHLEDQGCVVLVRPSVDRRGKVLVVVKTDEQRLVAEVLPRFLWERAAHRRAVRDVLVRAATGELLFATRDLPQLEQELTTSLRGNSAGDNFEWSDEDGGHLASYRTIFSQPQFQSNFVFASSQPRSIALAPVASFKRTFVLFGLLTICLVTIASVVQIRRSLAPVVLLKEATQRLAEGAEDERVKIQSDDEFEELGNSFNFMADRIRERTHELERANRAKAEFLANMSHEIRTPMNAVLGYVELARAEGVSQQDLAEYLQVIQKNGAHLLGVINSILDVSRIEDGHLAIQEEECCPAQLVQDVAQLLRPTAEAGDLKLHVAIDETVPASVVTDPQRLRQVLLNVIGNAIKYTERGEVRVAATWRGESGEGLLAVEVADTGPGIPSDKLERIFDAFFQADTSMSRRHGGTGLGLLISRQIARLLGGDVTCRSDPGRGSTFTITARAKPLDVTEPVLPAAPSAESKTPEATARPGRDCPRVLLVDDVAVNRKLVSVFLRRAGFEVEQGEDGVIALEKGLAALEAGEPYGIILMDMQMPEMDGYEATRRLRENGYRAPIVALTAHAFEGERQRCVEAGCDDYATKPIDNKTLVSMVRRYALGELSA